MSIPTGINVPGRGARLSHRRPGAGSLRRTIVVNCAGRTRSIIGCRKPAPGRGAEHGGGAAKRHDGVGARGPRVPATAVRPVAPCAGAAVDGGARRWTRARAFADASGVRTVDSAGLDAVRDMPMTGTARCMCSTCATRPSLRYGPPPRQPQRAGRAADPGDGPVDRGAWRPLIVLVDDDGVRARMAASLAAADGFFACFRRRERVGRHRRNGRRAAGPARRRFDCAHDKA